MSHILVVDDAADMRVLYRGVLDMIGHEVTEASNGHLALELLAARPVPDLVILDVQMPAMDGWEVLARIRSDGALANTRVVLCSVRTASADRRRGYELGCDGYVDKPANLDTFIAGIETALSRPDGEREAWRAECLENLMR